MPSLIIFYIKDMRLFALLITLLLLSLSPTISAMPIIGLITKAETNSFFIGLFSITQSLIILTAGIDLSVTAIMVLYSITTDLLSLRYGLLLPLSLFAGAWVGGFCGTLNCLLIGALIVRTFQSGLDVLWQPLALGCLIIFSVSTERWIREYSR